MSATPVAGARGSVPGSDAGSPLQRFSVVAQLAAADVIAAYSTSFGLATRLLGRRHRQHIRNIYAMVRIADEIVDGVASEAGLTPGEQGEVLDAYVAQTHRAMQIGYSSDLILHAFAQTARRVGIDESLTHPFFESMRVDLETSTTGDREAAAARVAAASGRPADPPHATTRAARPSAPAVFDATAHAAYVHGSAEVVGLMCLRVFLRAETTSEADALRLEYGARRLGAAFQNVNFLRDLGEDTELLGRRYLGSADRLTEPQRDAWVRTVREQLADARAVIPLLPRDARAAVRSALALFAELTDRVERASVDDLYETRVRVPNPVKAALTIRSLVTTWAERRA